MISVADIFSHQTFLLFCIYVKSKKAFADASFGYMKKCETNTFEHT